MDLKIALELTQSLTNLRTAYRQWKTKESERPLTPPKRCKVQLPRNQKPQMPRALPKTEIVIIPSSNCKPQTKVKRKRMRGRDKPNNKLRRQLGYYVTTFLEMELKDGEEFLANTRMNKSTFDLLLSLCERSLEKHSIRTSESPKSRLALTLMYLSQGQSIPFLAWEWKLGKETVRSILLETCSVLWKELQHNYVCEPSAEELRTITDDFWDMWQVPNCVGALDGKHITITLPARMASSESGKVKSLVVLAACNAHYKFTFIDVDSYGAPTLGGIFHTSCLCKRLLQGEISMPAAENLPNSRISMNNFFVANSAFPLHPHIMKPYPSTTLTDERIRFNQRIAGARGVIENAFGVLVARWKILSTNISMLPTNVEKVVLACVALHNFLCSNPYSRDSYIPPKFVDWKDEHGNIVEGQWRAETPQLIGIVPSRNGHSFQRNLSTRMRNELCAYINANHAR